MWFLLARARVWAIAVVLLPLTSMAGSLGTPQVHPLHPTTNTPVTVILRGGGCVYLDPVREARVVRDGNSVALFAPGFESQFSQVCFAPESERSYSLGVLPAGAYTLSAVLEDHEDNFLQYPYGTTSFVVGRPVRIPATGTLGLAAIVLMVFAVLACRGWKGAAMVLVVAGVVSVPDFARAANREVHVLLEGGAGATSAVDLVEGYDFASGLPPPIDALSVESPLSVEYLLPRRARGRFAQYLAEHPELPRARLERYVVVNYPDNANLGAALAAFNVDVAVEHAHIPATIEDAPLQGASGPSPSPPNQTWRVHVAADDARPIAAGWSLVGVLDSGIATQHPDLRAFAEGTSFSGGNFLEVLSADAGNAGMNGCQLAGNCITPNVDEREPLAVFPGSVCDSDADGIAWPAIGGHGTHVAGLLAARPGDSAGARGTCEHCGLAIWRIAFDYCYGPDLLGPKIRAAAIDASVQSTTEAGVQVINQSLVRGGIPSPQHCVDNALNSECLAMAYAFERDVLIVAAAGNNRAAIQFPANDSRVLAVGGLGESLELWDRSPQGTVNCPTPPAGQPLGYECGSNYTVDPATGRKQEVVAPAQAITSTFYPALSWNALGCADAQDGLPGDGYGLCTGTSMAAPIVSGIAGMLRSINPLVPVGKPDEPLAAPGIRSVLRSTTFEGAVGKSWDSKLGFGRVDADSAARRMLGVVAGSRVRNRAIPLFAFYSSDAADHAAVATPQAAVSVGLNQGVEWMSRGALVGGYPAFPAIAPPAGFLPRAAAFVLSTEFRTRSRQPAVVPLFLMDRPRPWPLGCTPGTTGCRSFHNDHILVSRVADLEQAHADGYRLLGRQGYVFQRCSPEPGCMPSAAVRLYRQCKVADDDCAVFVEFEKAAFEADGFTAAYPAGSDVVMGYAFANVDADQDELVDGFERMIGTSPTVADSDDDGVQDGAEYPLAAVPVSDPCGGAVKACDPPAFFNGFE